MRPDRRARIAWGYFRRAVRGAGRAGYRNKKCCLAKEEAVEREQLAKAEARRAESAAAHRLQLPGPAISPRNSALTTLGPPAAERAKPWWRRLVG